MEDESKTTILPTAEEILSSIDDFPFPEIINTIEERLRIAVTLNRISGSPQGDYRKLENDSSEITVYGSLLTPSDITASSYIHFVLYPGFSEPSGINFTREQLERFVDLDSLHYLNYTIPFVHVKSDYEGAYRVDIGFSSEAFWSWSRIPEVGWIGCWRDIRKGEDFWVYPKEFIDGLIINERGVRNRYEHSSFSVEELLADFVKNGGLEFLMRTESSGFSHFIVGDIYYDRFRIPEVPSSYTHLRPIYILTSQGDFSLVKLDIDLQESLFSDASECHVHLVGFRESDLAHLDRKESGGLMASRSLEISGGIPIWGGSVLNYKTVEVEVPVVFGDQEFCEKVARGSSLLGSFYHPKISSYKTVDVRLKRKT